jgi:hypothetical protein
MHLISDSTIQELGQHHVQLLNTTFANKKKRLDCFDEKPQKNLEKQDSGSALQQAATHGKVIVENEIKGEGELAEACKKQHTI